MSQNPMQELAEVKSVLSLMQTALLPKVIDKVNSFKTEIAALREEVAGLKAQVASLKTAPTAEPAPVAKRRRRTKAELAEEENKRYLTDKAKAHLEALEDPTPDAAVTAAPGAPSVAGSAAQTALEHPADVPVAENQLTSAGVASTPEVLDGVVINGQLLTYINHAVTQGLSKPDQLAKAFALPESVIVYVLTMPMEQQLAIIDAFPPTLAA